MDETSCPSSEQPSGASESTRDQGRVEAVAELERFHTAWFVHEATQTGCRLEVNLGNSTYFVDEFVPSVRPGPEIVGAAKIALRCLQDDLVALDSPVEFQVAQRLMTERLWAITALIQVGQSHRMGSATGHGYAKKVLLEVTDGAPLTICMGDVCRIRTGQRDGVETTVGLIPFAVKGCRAIFEEDRRTSGEMWAGLCPTCRRKKPRRDQGRALNRRINDLRRGRGATIYGWSVTVRDAEDGSR